MKYVFKIFTYSVEIKFVSLMKNALDEHKLHMESYLLNIVNKTPQPHLMTATHKQQQLDHIDYLISQGQVNLAIDQVTETSVVFQNLFFVSGNCLVYLFNY